GGDPHRGGGGAGMERATAGRVLDGCQTGAESVDEAGGTLGRDEPGRRANEQVVLQGRAQPRERMTDRGRGQRQRGGGSRGAVGVEQRAQGRKEMEIVLV